MTTLPVTIERRAPLNYTGLPLQLADDDALLRGIELASDDEFKQFMERLCEMRKPTVYSNQDVDRRARVREFMNGMRTLGRTPIYTAQEMALRIR